MSKIGIIGGSGLDDPDILERPSVISQSIVESGRATKKGTLLSLAASAFRYVPILLATSPDLVVLSLPTMHMSTSPCCIRCPPALSTMTVCGISSFRSSQAVKFAPWFLGLVSSTQTCIFIPASLAAYIGAVAVPLSIVANQPALQWVSILTVLSDLFSAIL